MQKLENLFTKNKAWADSIRQRDPDFFLTLSRQQFPSYLWIGCSDSRVPANEIVGLLPGELFVHRNVANLVVHSDLNCLSVMQYAVDVLKVRHIMVVGHYGCGGVAAAYRKQRVGLADNWLRHVADVRQKYETDLAKIEDPVAACDRLCELNVIEQVTNVCQTIIVRDAWERGQDLTVHGWVYGLQDGLLRDLNVSQSNVFQPLPTYAIPPAGGTPAPSAAAPTVAPAVLPAGSAFQLPQVRPAPAQAPGPVPPPVYAVPPVRKASGAPSPTAAPSRPPPPPAVRPGPPVRPPSRAKP